MSATAFPPSFPDDGRTKDGPTEFVRRGILSCSAISGCTFVLYPPQYDRCNKRHTRPESLTFSRRTGPYLSGQIEARAYCSTGLHPAGSNSLMAVAVSVVVFPKSFCSNTPSWFIMKLITPELPYSAG